MRTTPNSFRRHYESCARNTSLRWRRNTTNPVDNLPLSTAHYGHETHLLATVVAERTRKMCGYRKSAKLLYPAQRHAHVFRFDHDCNATRPENFVDRSRNLRCQMLLCLQSSRIYVDQTRKL